MDLSPGSADPAGTGLARLPAWRRFRDTGRDDPACADCRYCPAIGATCAVLREVFWAGMRACRKLGPVTPLQQDGRRLKGYTAGYTAFEACTCLLPLLSAKREARVAEGFPASYRVKHSSR
ncbi:hypothetical protein L489_4020 [Bordetella bronchiseptica 00-P-2730]|nr:hypothetical protein L489_4015 [Bordetella bronchiseptica 00-P-2730]KCV28089.1 hypothetical protein L489_4020 [Bordetella bronchiseptica 00-P-2730]KDD15285.1 hypothetical protein L522_3640 [Bordetella bronchiseptica MBORD707]